MSVQFTLTSEEGLPIRGDLDTPRNAEALVILLHGFKGFKDWGFFPWLAEYLCDQHFAVCRFNMSRCGIGDDPQTFDRLDLFADDTYSTELSDLRAIVRHSQSRVSLPTFLFGHSRGGGVAILAAANVPNLRGVITWSAIAHADPWDAVTVKQWRRDGHFDVINSRTKQVMRMSTRVLDDLDARRYDILGAVSRLQVPMLIVHGKRDESVPVRDSAELAAAAKDRAHVVISSATHTYNVVHPMADVPRELELAAAATARFISSYRE